MRPFRAKLRIVGSDGDTDTAGTYLAEFEVTRNGMPFTFPNVNDDDHGLRVLISEDRS